MEDVINQFLIDNPDYEINYIDEYQYIYLINSDYNTENDFVDLNNDGEINVEDNLYRQTMINTLGINDGTPVELTDAELQDILDQCVNLREVEIIGNYYDSEFGTNGFYTFEIGGDTIDHWDSMADFLDQTYEDVTNDITLYGSIMRDWVIEHQTSLLGFAHQLQKAAGYTQLTGLAIAAFTSITGAGAAFGAGLYGFGGIVNEIGVLMEVAILFIISDDRANIEFKDFLNDKIADGLLNSILPGHSALMPELNDAIDTINKAINQAYGNT